MNHVILLIRMVVLSHLTLVFYFHVKTQKIRKIYDICLCFCQCFCWCPKQSSDDILAVGLSSGKVILTAFLVDPTSSQMGLVGTEFPVKHNKMCTSLAWNTVEPKLVSGNLYGTINMVNSHSVSFVIVKSITKYWL